MRHFYAIFTKIILLGIFGFLSLNGFGQTTVSYDFSAGGASATGDALDANISFTAHQNSGTTAPVINGGQLRLYQNSTMGGSIRVSISNGVTVTRLQVFASGTTGPAEYNVDAGSAISISHTGGVYDANSLSASSNVEFWCVGSSSGTRIYVDSFQVTYTTSPTCPTITPQAVRDTITCDSVQLGNIWYSSNTNPAYDTIKNMAGTCDSIINTYNVIVNQPTAVTVDTTSCDSVEVNGVWYSSDASGIMDTARYASGCDSIIYTYNITINSAMMLTIDTTSCDSVEVNGVWYSSDASGIMDTARYASGCDSIIYTYNITINSAMMMTVDTTSCDSVEVNGVWYSSDASGIMDTARYASGCDSVIYVYNITINSFDTTKLPSIDSVICGSSFVFNGNTFMSDTVINDTLKYMSGCDSAIQPYNFMVNDVVVMPQTDSIGCDSVMIGSTWYSTTGTIVNDTARYASGCDSVVYTFRVVIEGSFTHIDTSALGSFTTPLGKTTMVNALLTDSTQTTNGCYDIIEYDVTIVSSIDTSITVSGAGNPSPTLTVGQSGATYQWVNCLNANAPIPGATSQSYTPTMNGRYAVIVTVNGVSVMSRCIIVNTISVEEIITNNSFKVIPNPNNGVFKVELDAVTTDIAKIQILNIAGQIVLEQRDARINSNFKSGVYFIRIETTDKHILVQKLIIQ